LLHRNERAAWTKQKAYQLIHFWSFDNEIIFFNYKNGQKVDMNENLLSVLPIIKQGHNEMKLTLNKLGDYQQMEFYHVKVKS
jgi:hypothetical protein